MICEKMPYEWYVARYFKSDTAKLKAMPRDTSMMTPILFSRPENQSGESVEPDKYPLVHRLMAEGVFYAVVGEANHIITVKTVFAPYMTLIVGNVFPPLANLVLPALLIVYSGGLDLGCSGKTAGFIEGPDSLEKFLGYLSEK